eukprot:TRINITY_DN3194_c0_g1_i2.p1 TRINITY_DN3194_c0_g1~~TRINITY_DN3194_c0_g1_i2.p1  ORF type:complete len:277 (+),score=45.51 TRINITY_DN3194_c0_g1_i2:211-1041(+)
MKFPPAQDYVHRFLKMYIAVIESQSFGVYEPILDAYFEVMSAPNVATDKPPFYKTYHVAAPYNLNITVQVAAQFNQVGLAMWDAGFFLTEFILGSAELFRDRVCLELGTGVGLTGPAFAAVAPRYAVLTDYAESVLQNLRHNLEINSLSPVSFSELQQTGPASSCRLAVEQLDWEHCDDAVLGSLCADIIVAADCVYDLDLTVALVRVLDRLLRMRSGAVAYVASTLRNPPTYEAFRRLLNECGLVVTDVAHSDVRLMEVFVYNREPVQFVKIVAP